MRTIHTLLATLSIVSLTACNIPTITNASKTTMGWVLEDAGTDENKRELTHISVYADTINTKGELERTNIFEVETMPGCEHAPNGDVRCAADGFADELRLHQEEDGTVTFGHRNIPADENDDDTPFETLKTFNEEDFYNTRLEIGVARNRQEPL